MKCGVLVVAVVAMMGGRVGAQEMGPITHEGIVEAPLDQGNATTLSQLQRHFAGRPR